MTSIMHSSSEQSAYSQLRSGLLLRSIPALDGIRAIAVFLVILYHLSNQRTLPAFPGPLGVLGFFVLSGLLITWLLIKEEEKHGAISLKGFYRRRALRIFPAFYVFWIVAVASRLVAHGQEVPWSQAFSAFFYVSNYFHALFHPTPDYMIHTWSLSAEEQFYLLWPLSFVMFSKKKRLLMVGLGSVIAAIWIHRFRLWIVAHATYYITYAFDTRADALLVGCFLALALKEGLGRWLLEKVCGPVWAPVVTILLIGVSVFTGQLSEGYKLTGGLAIEPLLVAILICQLVVQSSSGPWRWLNAKPVVYLGKISYPLYLYHLLATHLTTRLAARIPGLSTPLFVVMAILVGIFIASCSYHFVEKPFLTLKDKGASPSVVARARPTSPGIAGRTGPSATPAS
jgi:peptidoglycan/LPS O-acetylase OafA/YrhL